MKIRQIVPVSNQSYDYLVISEEGEVFLGSLNFSENIINLKAMKCVRTEGVKYSRAEINDIVAENKKKQQGI